MGMGGMIRVDSEIFTWLGGPEPAEFGPMMNFTGQIITPTSTIRSYSVKTDTVDISMNATFLSPIEVSRMLLLYYVVSTEPRSLVWRSRTAVLSLLIRCG